MSENRRGLFHSVRNAIFLDASGTAMHDELEDSYERPGPSMAFGLIALVGIAGILFYHQQTWGALLIDETYEGMRLGAHLILGDGLVFNAGDTGAPPLSPLYTLWLAGGQYLGLTPGDSALSASLSGALLGSGWILFAAKGLLWRVAASMAIVAMLLIPSFVYLLLSGSEYLLFGSLLCGSMTQFARGRYGFAGLLAGLGFLTRFEVALFALPVVIGLALSQRKNFGKFLLGLAIPLVGWGVFAQLSCGRVLPEWGEWSFGGHPSNVWSQNVSALTSGRSLQIAWILAGMGLGVEFIQRSRTAAMGGAILLLFAGLAWTRTWPMGMGRVDTWSALALIPCGFYFVTRLIHWMAVSLAGRRWGLAVVLIAGSVPIVFAVDAETRGRRSDLLGIRERHDEREICDREIAREIRMLDPEGVLEVCTDRLGPLSLAMLNRKFTKVQPMKFRDRLESRSKGITTDLIPKFAVDSGSFVLAKEPLFKEVYQEIFRYAEGESTSILYCRIDSP